MSGSVLEKSRENNHFLACIKLMPLLVIFSILLSCNRTLPLQTVERVDLSRYSGKWYEIAAFPQRFQKDCFCTTAEYKPTGEGYISILNKCNKGSVDGPLDSATGKAFIDRGSGNAKLKVQFFWPFKGKYWIIDLASDYSHAVVGHPNRDYLWILSRQPIMNASLYHSILTKLSTQGFDTNRLVKTIHRNEK
jgi:apolipoprotein D and lipocalin family protein